MSEPNPEPSVEMPSGPPIAPAPSPVAPGPVAPAPAAARRPWGLLVVVAAVSLLVGIGGTTAAFLLPDLYDRLNPPEYTFDVSIFLRADVTTAQKDALGAALDSIDALDGVVYESREEAYENFKRLYQDSPELVESVRPEALPESFQFKTRGTDFDCDVLRPVRDLPGIEDILVSGFSKEAKPPIRQVTCD